MPRSSPPPSGSPASLASWQWPVDRVTPGGDRESRLAIKDINLYFMCQKLRWLGNDLKGGKVENKKLFFQNPKLKKITDILWKLTLLLAMLLTLKYCIVTADIYIPFILEMYL